MKIYNTSRESEKGSRIDGCTRKDKFNNKK